MATEADKTNNGVIGTIVAVGVFAMIAVSAAVTAMVRAEVSSTKEAEGSNADLRTVRELKAAQRSELSSTPKWVDKGKGVVTIPIDQAMGLVIRDLSQNPELASPTPPPAEHADAEGDANKQKSNESSKTVDAEGKAKAPAGHEPSKEGRTL